jgi:hypothetical protein
MGKFASNQIGFEAAQPMKAAWEVRGSNLFHQGVGGSPIVWVWPSQATHYVKGRIVADGRERKSAARLNKLLAVSVIRKATCLPRLVRFAEGKLRGRTTRPKPSDPLCVLADPRRSKKNSVLERAAHIRVPDQLIRDRPLD